MISESTTETTEAPTVPILALNAREAAKALGVCRTTFWKLSASGKIRATEYGRYPVSELQRHLDEQTKVATVRRGR